MDILLRNVQQIVHSFTQNYLRNVYAGNSLMDVWLVEIACRIIEDQNNIYDKRNYETQALGWKKYSQDRMD